MIAVASKGMTLTDYRIVTSINHKTEEGGNDYYMASYQIKFSGQWVEMDMVGSMIQDVDLAAADLHKRAVKKWNIKIDGLKIEA